MKVVILLLVCVCVALSSSSSPPNEIIHDIEYEFVKRQNADKWAKEDDEVQQKLDALHEKFGQPPNIIHLLFDDTPFGDVGIEALQRLRGFKTPNMNKMGEDGAFFTRFMTEPSCTPTRAATLTGRYAVRSGMAGVDFAVAGSGLAGDEVTIAEILREKGYKTGFFGKAHLGDIEEAYMHNQGFDEALFAVYNQISSLWNPKGEAANVNRGMFEQMLQPDPYKMDNEFNANGWVMNLEGGKGKPTLEYGGLDDQDYRQSEKEFQKRSLQFIRDSVEEKKPFLLNTWPLLTSFFPSMPKTTESRTLLGEGLASNVDVFVGQIVALLEELNIAENTLLVVGADNGPMIHDAPPGCGFSETFFRGGKGDFLEGGVRTPHFATWPGVIKPGFYGDMFHTVDLLPTFARLGNATELIPRDRVIDGIDQTSLLLNGDTHGRRDHAFIYTGEELGAVVKGNVKFHLKGAAHGSESGISASFYDLLNDPRETAGILVPFQHRAEAMHNIINNHQEQIKRFPHRPKGVDYPLTGIENARPITLALKQKWDERQEINDHFDNLAAKYSPADDDDDDDDDDVNENRDGCNV